MKSAPTCCSMQKSMTCRVALCERIAHAPLGSPAHFVLRPLELFPTAGVPGAAALLFGKLPELSVALPLERANATSGDDERRARARGQGSKVDFSEVDGCLYPSGSVFR